MTGPKRATPQGPRVYEYIADDGTRYWSLDRTLHVVSPPTRLFLTNRVGTPFLTFLSRFRRQVETPEREER